MELDIEVLTPHGKPVSGASVRVTGAGLTCLAEETAPGMYEAALPAPGEYQVAVSRPAEPGGFEHRAQRKILVHAQGDRHHVHVTLEYLWFTPIGYPPTLGNQVEVFTDGEEGWGAVASAARKARRSVRVVTWMYEASMTLERQDPMSDPEQREAQTVQSLLESLAAAGVLVQLLLWREPLHNLPAKLAPMARATGDNFEVMREQNPTAVPLFVAGIVNDILGGVEIGSYHQKTMVIDGRIGFCGGMNLEEHDWDSRDHHVFDPRRCHFSRPAAFREKVRDRACHADYPPRHDFVARIEGPAVAHIEENFRERWNYLIERGEAYSTSATPVPAPAPLEAGQSTSQVQVVRTMPEPFSERGILDVYLRAIGNARRLIYIEDQFFRSTRVSSAIADALRAWPGLSVIVVTAESRENQLFSGGWIYACFEWLKAERPRFELYTLRSSAEDARGEVVIAEVDIHAKLMMVDDHFLTVGSCNINDRGFEYEGEINLAVVDPELVRRFRVDLFREHLGGDARISGDIEADVLLWKEHAEANRRFDPVKDPLPASRVFPFTPRRRGLGLLGPDVF